MSKWKIKHEKFDDRTPTGKIKRDVSDERRQQISESSKLNWKNPEFRKKVIESQRGIKPSKDTLENMRLAQKRKSDRSKDTFELDSRKFHGNKYDYSKVNYVNSKTDIVIICPEHGAWMQTASTHMSGSGCNECGKLSRAKAQTSDTDTFIKKSKVIVAAKKLREINPTTKIRTYKSRLDENNIKKIIKNYEIIIDGSDNFKTKFLINDYCKKLKKKLVTGAISKFDGHVFTFDFNDRKTASLKNFYQENEISDDDLNCEFEGVLGTTASIVGTTQANEALKMIMKIGQTLKNQILIIDLLNLNFRKVKFNRK